MNDERIEYLKKLKFLEENRSKACFDAFCALEDVNNEFASELYNLHKIHLNNAFECEMLLMEYNEWLNEYENVINKIESGED